MEAQKGQKTIIQKRELLEELDPIYKTISDNGINHYYNQAVEFGYIEDENEVVIDTSNSVPYIGGYFSSSKNLQDSSLIVKLVKECDKFWHFEDLRMYRKDKTFWWYEHEKPIDKIESNDPFIFPYKSYSLWSRQLASQYTINELRKVVNECSGLTDKYAKQHLAAIQATTSMQSQSQRRAHARNNVTANYERKMAYENAIELYEYYPDKCKLK